MDANLNDASNYYFFLFFFVVDKKKKGKSLPLVYQ